MVDAELMPDRRQEVGAACPTVDSFVAEIVGPTVGVAGLEAAAGVGRRRGRRRAGGLLIKQMGQSQRPEAQRCFFQESASARRPGACEFTNAGQRTRCRDCLRKVIAELAGE